MLTLLLMPGCKWKLTLMTNSYISITQAAIDCKFLAATIKGLTAVNILTEVNAIGSKTFSIIQKDKLSEVLTKLIISDCKLLASIFGEPLANKLSL